MATVAIDGSYNAAMLAAQILAVSDGALADQLAEKRAEMTRGVLEKDQQLQEIRNQEKK